MKLHLLLNNLFYSRHDENDISRKYVEDKLVQVAIEDDIRNAFGISSDI